MRKVIIKEGPLVFLRDVFIMELVAAAGMYALSFLENYEQLFRTWGFARYIRYDIFLILAFSLFQLAYVTALFFYWYADHYEINDKEIVHAYGSLFRHRKMVPLASVASVETSQPMLIGRLMPSHATIILEHDGGRVTKIRNVSNFQEYVHIIQHMVHDASGRVPAPAISELISRGESHSLEFKETLRYDARKGETSKELEHAVIKTIVGFLNADGGTLLIGVNDSCEAVGLDNDYKALPKKNRDGFENHLSMLIKTMIGLPFAKYVGVRFEQVNSKDVCVVSARQSHKPAYLRNGERKEEFFVRVGNSTQPFTMSEAEEYIQAKWK